MFPGQGSQKIGMGEDLAGRYAVAKESFEEADDVLGFSLSELCFKGPTGELALTANTQPAVLACSVAAARVLERERGIKPAIALGHSLGEFSALVSVGALDFADALRLVRLRGEAMQHAVPEGEGGMAAIVGLELEAVDTLCRDASNGDILAPANENGGGQVVVAGHKKAVRRAMTMAKERGARVILLRVSAPFHCSLMKPAANELAKALESIEIHAMRAPVIANVNALANTDPGRVKSLLVSQVTSRVRWEASVRQLVHAGFSAALEVGHGRVLSGLAKRISPQLCVSPVGSPADVDVLNVGS